jgi:hypothetical protein
VCFSSRYNTGATHWIQVEIVIHELNLASVGRGQAGVSVGFGASYEHGSGCR